MAVSDSDQRVATAVTVVQRSGDLAADHRALTRLAAEYEAVGLVVGLPRGLSGQHGPAARLVLEEVPKISAAAGLAVETVDERFTTVQAAAALRESGIPARGQRGVLDQVAAAVLLQSWLDHRDAAASDPLP